MPCLDHTHPCARCVDPGAGKRCETRVVGIENEEPDANYGQSGSDAETNDHPPAKAPPSTGTSSFRGYCCEAAGRLAPGAQVRIEIWEADKYGRGGQINQPGDDDDLVGRTSYTIPDIVNYAQEGESTVVGPFPDVRQRYETLSTGVISQGLFEGGWDSSSGGQRGTVDFVVDFMQSRGRGRPILRLHASPPLRVVCVAWDYCC